MKKIKSKADVPSWFNLDHYNCLKELNFEELKQQIDQRRYLYETASASLTNGSQIDFGICGEEFDLIKSGSIITRNDMYLGDPPYYDKEFLIEGDNRLCQSNPISGFKSVQAYLHCLDLIENKLLSKNEFLDAKTIKRIDKLGDLDFVARTLKRYDIASLNPFPIEEEYITITIDIETFTNSEIKQDLDRLLPIWRKQLDIQEPEVSFQTRSDHTKILEYQIIPLLDLMIWTKLNNTSITKSVYAGILFPDFSRGDTEMRQTIIPFLKKITGEFYRVKKK